MVAPARASHVCSEPQQQLGYQCRVAGTCHAVSCCVVFCAENPGWIRWPGGTERMPLVEYRTERLPNASPAAQQRVLKALLGLGVAHDTGLEPKLLELVKMRASQINGCAFCLDMHTKDARAMGETEQRLYLLPAWREADLYSERERAALAWTEALTDIAEDRVPDEVYDEVRPHFTDDELAFLTLAIVAINSFNRFNVAFRMPAGSYQPGAFAGIAA